MKNKQLHCTFCESDVLELCFETVDVNIDKYSIYYCRKCNAYSLLPLPDAVKLAKAYDSSYYGANNSKFSNSVERYIDLFRKRKAKKIVKYLPKNGRILDIGCGNGRFLNYLSFYGTFNLYGSEREGNSAKRASQFKHIRLKTSPMQKGDFLPNSFDVITMFHVFEHLNEPRQILEIVTEIIKPNGIVIISMPDIGSWQARIFKGYWYHLDPPRHLIFFKRKHLKNMMSKNGFKCIDEESISFEQNPYGWVQSLLNKMLKRREVLYERLKGNRTYAPEYKQFSLMLQKLFLVLTLPYFFFQELMEALLKKSATFKMTFQYVGKK